MTEKTFAEIRDSYGLELFDVRPRGTLYAQPAVIWGRDRLIVRHFDKTIPPDFVRPYASLTAAAQAWIDAQPALSTLVRIVQPTEIGADFIARPYEWYMRSIAHYGPGVYAQDETPPPVPPEFARMQHAFRAAALTSRTPKARLIAEMLRRSLLEFTHRTSFDETEAQFVVVDVAPTLDELERWRDLAGREDA